MRSTRTSFAVVLGLLGLLSACARTPMPDGTAADVPSAEDAVVIAGFRFQPDELRVAPGATVTWANEDEILHTVTGGTPSTPERALLDGSLPEPGATYQAVFEEPGTYAYFCDRHRSMRGRVVVG